MSFLLSRLARQRTLREARVRGKKRQKKKLSSHCLPVTLCGRSHESREEIALLKWATTKNCSSHSRVNSSNAGGSSSRSRRSRCVLISYVKVGLPVSRTVQKSMENHFRDHFLILSIVWEKTESPFSFSFSCSKRKEASEGMKAVVDRM